MSTQNSRVLMSIQYEWKSPFFFGYAQTFLRKGIIYVGVLMSTQNSRVLMWTQYEGMNEQVISFLVILKRYYA